MHGFGGGLDAAVEGAELERPSLEMLLVARGHVEWVPDDVDEDKPREGLAEAQKVVPAKQHGEASLREILATQNHAAEKEKKTHKNTVGHTQTHMDFGCFQPQRCCRRFSGGTESMYTWASGWRSVRVALGSVQVLP